MGSLHLHGCKGGAARGVEQTRNRDTPPAAYPWSPVGNPPRDGAFRGLRAMLFPAASRITGMPTTATSLRPLFRLGQAALAVQTGWLLRSALEARAGVACSERTWLWSAHSCRGMLQKLSITSPHTPSAATPWWAGTTSGHLPAWLGHSG
jgi:hypothetical protein